MKIGEVIRKYRKERQLTQEETARILGVTASAVNKWENGVSYPDIFLLAPIARLFGISTDTLLSYREDLTPQEIRQALDIIQKTAQKSGFEAAFAWAEERIQEYPNCLWLIYSAAQLLDTLRTLYGIPEPERYDERLVSLYTRALSGTDAKLAETAAVSLFLFYLAKEDYEKAEEFLNRLPKGGNQYRQFHAILCQRQGNLSMAYSLYEQNALTAYSDLNSSLYGIIGMAIAENNMKKAETVAEKLSGLARLMEMGPYMELSPWLGIALKNKDKEKTLEILSGLVQNLQNLQAFQKSELYSHVSFSEFSKNTAGRTASTLLPSLENDPEIDFIRNAEAFRVLLEKIRSLAESESPEISAEPANPIPRGRSLS